MNIFSKFGLKEVINACGKMTVLGGSAVSEEVSLSVKEALMNYVVIDELMDFVSKVISDKTGAESGLPTCGAASGTVISTASLIAGEDLNIIERIPNTDGLKNEIIIQKGHAINFGGSITQMIRLGGGCPIEVGCANKVYEDNIKCAVNEKTAAIYYVKSHHAVQKGMQSIENVIKIAKEYKLPLVVDAAAEEDLKKYVALGADMVLYSGGKAINGPTSGFICGKHKFIKACRSQYRGVGRAMKVSKEAMVGLIASLENYNVISSLEQQMKKLKFICDELNKLDELKCTIVQDEAGREIYRANIKIKENKNFNAFNLNSKLKAGNPAIFLREYYVDSGILSVDPRSLLDGQESTIVSYVKKYVKEGLLNEK